MVNNSKQTKREITKSVCICTIRVMIVTHACKGSESCHTLPRKVPANDAVNKRTTSNTRTAQDLKFLVLPYAVLDSSAQPPDQNLAQKETTERTNAQCFGRFALQSASLLLAFCAAVPHPGRRSSLCRPCRAPWAEGQACPRERLKCPRRRQREVEEQQAVRLRSYR